MRARTCIAKNISLPEMYKLVPTVLMKLEVSWDPPITYFDLLYLAIWY